MLRVWQDVYNLPLLWFGKDHEAFCKRWAIILWGRRGTFGRENLLTATKKLVLSEEGYSPYETWKENIVWIIILEWTLKVSTPSPQNHKTFVAKECSILAAGMKTTRPIAGPSKISMKSSQPTSLDWNCVKGAGPCLQKTFPCQPMKNKYHKKRLKTYLILDFCFLNTTEWSMEKK